MPLPETAGTFPRGSLQQGWPTARLFGSSRIVAVTVLIAGLAIGSAPTCPADEPEKPFTAAQVLDSIQRGAQFLKEQQLPDGSWPDRPGYAHGLTPLCTLALLHSGLGPQDPAVAKALEFLRKLAPNATYTTSLQTMAFCAAEPARDRELIVRNVQWLDSRQHKRAPKSGMWAISNPGSPDHTDNSMTHLAMLALYDAERVGVLVDDATWRLAQDHWVQTQNPDGSWGWGPGYAGTGSMTAAGIAVMLMADARLGIGDAKVAGEQIDCCQPILANAPVEKAIQWLSANFSINHNPHSDFWHSYYLYSLERAGRMTGARQFGGHDWYREGARVLVETQFLSGGWPSDIEEEYAGDPLVSCAFDLMFLAKGRRPIVLAHVQWGGGADWNRHRRAMLNLVTRTEQAWQRELAYQTVGIASATVEELLESPVLVLSGRDGPQLSANDKGKLRAYLDRGGFLFGVQSCGGGTFDAGFRALVRELFPESPQGLTLLPPEHPAWRAEAPVDPPHLRPLWGLESACRTSVIYAPDDLACRWELSQTGRMARYPRPIQDEIRAADRLGINILAYATGRELRYKDPVAPRPLAAGSPVQFERGKLYVANVLHAGGCTAAPNAWRTLLSTAQKKFDVPCDPEPRQVRLSDADLFEYHLIVMHGSGDFELTPAERTQLREYVMNGGMLFADAICSSPEFASAFRRELQAALPKHRLAPIPRSDSLFSQKFGGAKIDQLEVRDRATAPGANAAPIVRTESPRLEGIKIDDRYAVVFSPLDLSCALEGGDSANCPGYARQAAAKLALNILLYSLHN